MEKFKKYLVYIITFTLLFMGAFYLLRSVHAFGEEYEYTEESLIEIHNFYTRKALKYSEYNYYIKERDYHYKKGVYHYDQAYMACWYCPRINDQEKARMCLVSSVSVVGCATASLQLVAIVTSFSLQYGLECMREWNFIKKNLHEAQHHFEMYEFYLDVLAKA